MSTRFRNGVEMAEKKIMTTNLPLPVPLRRRIERQAEADGRTLKKEIQALLLEALDKREARA